MDAFVVMLLIVILGTFGLLGTTTTNTIW